MADTQGTPLTGLLATIYYFDGYLLTRSKLYLEYFFNAGLIFIPVVNQDLAIKIQPALSKAGKAEGMNPS